MRAELNIVRKDWAEWQKPVIMMTLGLQAVLLLSGKLGDFGNGLALGLLFGGSFAFAQFCFVMEHERGTLDLLLSLPIRPRNVVLAKYASLYSMVLFLVNVPGIYEIVLGNLRMVFFANAGVLLASTICVTPPVLSGRPLASIVPLALVPVIFSLPADRRPAYVHALALHSMPVAIAALLAAPAAALLAASLFERKSLQ